MIQGISGPRGKVGIDFTAASCLTLARSFGAVIGKGKVLVGRDTRPSGLMAFNAVKEGLLATGHPVIDLGIIPTPAIEFAVTLLSAAGAIIITASHNPGEWNGLKFLDNNGLFLSPEKIASVYQPPQGKGARDGFPPSLAVALTKASLHKITRASAGKARQNIYHTRE